MFFLAMPYATANPGARELFLESFYVALEEVAAYLREFWELVLCQFGTQGARLLLIIWLALPRLANKQKHEKSFPPPSIYIPEVHDASAAPDITFPF